jgi:hypothetical protein
MRCGGRIPGGDNLFRHAIYPLFLSKKSFASEKLIHLSKEADGSLLTSVAWERYVPTVEHIHSYGCRIALGINDKKRAVGKLTDKNRHFYCGAYQLGADAVRALVSAENLDEISSADVIHHIEAGEIAHTDLRILLKPGVSDIEDTKTAIIDRLWNIFSGPLMHVCDCDLDVSPHPNLTLTTPPTGAYSDTRSYLRRLWSLIRFHACCWLWRSFEKKAAPLPPA